MFDFRKFLDTVYPGDTARVLVANYGYKPPSEAALHKWRVRRNIPSPWFALLLVIAEFEAGGPVSIGAFLKRRMP